MKQNSLNPKPITKTTCKRVIGALHDLGVTEYRIRVEGNALTVHVGNNEEHNTVADRISRIA